MPRHPTVLVIDDNSVDREAVRRLLSGRYEVVEAASAQAGLTLCLADPPDAVLLDYRLPDRDGLELLGELVAQDVQPVLMLTGQGEEEVAVRALKTGASDYLIKGRIDRDGLRRSLDKALETVRLREEVRTTRSALQLAERRYRTLFESTLQGVFISTPDGRLVDCNQEFANIFGFESVPEAIAHGAVSLYRDPGHRKRFIEALRERRQMQAVELELVTPSGEPRFVLETSVAVLDESGELVEINGYLIDITDRKKVRDQRDLLATAVRQAAEAIIITSSDGSIEHVNPAFERMSGYTAADVAGRNPRILQSGRHDESFYRAMWETLRSGEVWSGRIINRRKDGVEYQVDATISSVKDPDGSIAGYMAFQKDITREVELEAQLHAAQRLESVGKLAAGIAHDFNNLMTVVLGGVEAAAEAPDLVEARVHLDEVADATLSARSLTSQLLAFARQQVMQPRRLNLNETLEDMSRMLDRLLGDEIMVELDLAPGVGPVRADPSRLRSVVLNLALNARDAMPRGGVLRLQTRPARAAPGFTTRESPTHDRFVVLSVEDSGCGIDEATIDRVFEPFFTTKAASKGTGMGLAMVYGTVKQSDGYIEVESSPGEGTTFTIYLPEVAGPMPARPTDGTKPTPPADATVLLVDDDEAVLRTVRRTLASLGYDVETANHGSVALDMLMNGFGPDLLITDFSMPGMTGTDLVRALEEGGLALPVLFVSGYAANRALDQDALSVPHDFLEKPFTREELAERVRELLARTQTA